MPGRLLALLHWHGPLTRAEATARMGTARSAVGNAVTELEGLGLIRALGEASSPQRLSAGRGRTSPVLEVNQTGPVAAAVRLHPAGADIAISGLGQSTGPVRRLSIPWTTQSLERSIAALGGSLTDAITSSGRRCVGVCVGVAGIVSRDHDAVRSALYLGWNDVPLADIIRARVPGEIPVSVHNDAALTACAEFRHGAGQGASTLLTLTCEHTGIGAAMLTADSPRMPQGEPLEAGHLVLDPFGALCSCGQNGCLELYCDGRALSQVAEKLGTHDPAVSRKIIQAAGRGDARALQAVQAVTSRLGAALVTFTNLLSPEKIVLSGLLADYQKLTGDDLSVRLRRSIVARALGTTLAPGSVSNPVLVGAAEQAFTALLRDPARTLRQSA